MKFCFETLAALALISAMTGAHAQTTSGRRSAPHKQPAARRASTEPSVADQIQALRQELETQIQELKQQLSDRDRQLQEAQQAAADGWAPRTTEAALQMPR